MRKKILIPLFVLFLIAFAFYQNNAIEKTYLTYKSNAIPQGFNDYRIIHISDLHNKAFGERQERLLKKIREESPDIIVITGDLIDRRKFDLPVALDFIKGAVEISPVYYVPGNHEAWSGEYAMIRKALKALDVKVLDDTKEKIYHLGDSIEVLGLKDPDFQSSSYIEGNKIDSFNQALKALSKGKEFKVLLSHRPELFDFYVHEEIDLVFSGHAHGGQLRLPIIGGVVAPDQGFFPKYTSALYKKGQTTMVVSRGLGNSIIPLRVFNRPELVVLILSKKDKIK